MQLEKILKHVLNIYLHLSGYTNGKTPVSGYKFNLSWEWFWGEMSVFLVL